MTEATAVIARGIGKPDLRYEQLTYDQMRQGGWTQRVLRPKKAAVYIEMFQGHQHRVSSLRKSRGPQGNSTPTSFENILCGTSLCLHIGEGFRCVSSGCVSSAALVFRLFARLVFRKAASENCRLGDRVMNGTAFNEKKELFQAR